MWFTEGIVNGLNRSKSRKLILMVYLEGKNEASIEMTKQLETDEDIKLVVIKNAIALKLVENSKDAKMFHQIYPVKPSPVVYLISSVGKLLNSFSDKLDKDIFIKHLNESSIISATEQNVEASSSSESTEPTNLSSNIQASSSPPVVQTTIRTIDEKREELLERVKEKSAKAQENRARNQEMERIQSGKELQKLRKEHEQREAEQLIKQRARDAQLDKIERERILKRIEEDRQEKDARFEQERLKREAEYNKYQKELAEKNALKNRATIKLEENEIKIQFRLPDSQILITKFKLDDTLQTAVDYVKEKSELKKFQFAITYPKRNLDSKDFELKFVDLGIKNSAVLLVVEEEGAKSSSSNNKNSIVSGSIISSAYEICFSICSLVISLISGLFSSLFGGGGEQRSDRASQPSSDNQQPPNTFDAKRRGFRSNFDRDDDNRNTYNGNSTEQQ